LLGNRDPVPVLGGFTASATVYTSVTGEDRNRNNL
jgi:hypothetical protein